MESNTSIAPSPTEPDAALVELGKALLQAHRAAEEFSAFTNPLLAKIEYLYTMFATQVVEHGKPDPWSRPGLWVTPSRDNGGGLHLMVELPGIPRVSVEDTGRRGFNIYGHHTNSSGTAQVLLNLNHDFYQQDELVQKHWNKSFEHANLLIDRAIASINTGTPLQEGSSWPEALLGQLDREHPVSYQAARWERWLSQWGTPEMQTSFSVAQSLFDVTKEHAAWKSLLLESWSFVPCVDATVVSGDLFDPK